MTLPSLYEFPCTGCRLDEEETETDVYRTGISVEDNKTALRRKQHSAIKPTSPYRNLCLGKLINCFCCPNKIWYLHPTVKCVVNSTKILELFEK